MKKTLITLATAFLIFKAQGQAIDSSVCKSLPDLQILTSLINSPFGESFHRSKDSLKIGFTLQLSDPSFTIKCFRANYLSDDGDIYYRDIQGNKATPDNFPILKFLKGGELIEIDCVTIQRKQQANQYNSVPFLFFVDK